MTADARVPAYLGRVLNSSGEPVGTCFQVAPGVVVTAAHVLGDLGADEVGAVVSIDPLGGGAARAGEVARIEAVLDLAVVVVAEPFEASVVGLVATDGVAIGVGAVVTGVADIPDADHTYGPVDAPGKWAGAATKDHVPMGHLDAKAVMKGMSGAPVRRLGDDRVIGVVSGRHNSADGWLRDSVWVARTEALQGMCEGVVALALAQVAPAGRRRLRLAVDDTRVRLHGDGVDIAAPHGGVSPGLAGAVDDVRRARARSGPTRADAAGDLNPMTLGLGRAGRLLGASFLPAKVADALGSALGRARAAHQGLSEGVEVAGPLARLPWEALPAPGGDRPLALHPLVDVYRATPGAGVGAIPGPLRILVAIASPTSGGGEILDYERELRNVVAAVRAARAGEAHVREVRFATTAAIRSALEAGPAHVLHVSAHGSPGTLELERDDGTARVLTVERFVDEAIPPGAMPPLVCLAACHTNVAGNEEPSFAAGLLARGAAAVVATETSVTDRYATMVFSRLYGRLAEAPRPEVIAALCDARRGVQAELENATGGAEQQLAQLDEWAVVTVAAPDAEVVLFDPATRDTLAPEAEAPRIGLVAGRGVGDFVGRRVAQREWPAELVGPGRAGLGLHGIGGIGKTTLTSELVAIVQATEPDRLLAQVAGEVKVDDVLSALAAAVRQHLVMAHDTTSAAFQALEVATRQDVAWRDRFALLRKHVLGAIPLLVVVDNFEDNLAGPAPGPVVDEDLGELFAGWVVDPGASRLLFTCRYAFSLPRGAEAALRFKNVGPISTAETAKLVWSLPALDRLDPVQVEAVWRMVGGHPRSLEYLDALLSKGAGRYPDITTRLKKSLTKKLGAQEATALLASQHTLDTALAETAVLAADDVLLDDLVAGLDPGAERLLVGASVYREPVDLHALAFQVGKVDEGAAFVPDRQGANERIGAILAEAGVDTTAGPIDADTLAPAVLEALAPHVAEMARRPTPARRAPAGLAGAVAAVAATTLVRVEEADGDTAFFVHRWSAAELARRWADAGRSGEVVDAHRRAADYWRWRVEVWPQDRADDLHDLLEARHHLLGAGDLEEAGAVTETACSQLDVWGAWDREEALILDTLRRLPEGSDRRAAWILQLGILAQDRGDYEGADARCRQALEIKERLGKQAGMAASYHQLGMLAQLRGDYGEAEARYRQSLEIEERLGNLAGMAASYHQLGMLAQLRGDYGEAEARYRQSLEIEERLGNLAGMAASYHQLGMLAQLRGDYGEAEARYRQSLEINERLGKQAGMASGYSQLGILIAQQGSQAQAVEWHVQALSIRLRLAAPQVSIDLLRLAGLRAGLGRKRFDEVLGTRLDDESRANLLGMLEEFEAMTTPGTDEPPGG